MEPLLSSDLDVIVNGRNLGLWVIYHSATGSGKGALTAECGGSMMCATCHVYVREPWGAKLHEMSATEHEMLTMTVAERKPSSRLSCQIILSDALDGIMVDAVKFKYIPAPLTEVQLKEAFQVDAVR